MDMTQAMGGPGRMAAADVFRERGRIRDRLRAFTRNPSVALRLALEELPFDYPPSLILTADAMCALVGIAAAIQRHAYWPTPLPILAVLMLFVSVPLFCLVGIVPHPVLLGVGSLVAAALFLVQPVSADFAPFVLMIGVGEVAAIAPKRVSLVFGVAAIAELIAFAVYGHVLWDTAAVNSEGLSSYCAGVVLGWMVGVMLQFQRRHLYQEREYQQFRANQAADEERHRIAREVHDVIAHSLSITLLHLTAARHTLQTDRDVDEAVDALVDAERLGRQAMSDIRRTVGLLDSRPSKPAPEPGLADFDDLVGDFVRAGLLVDYVCDGETDAVSAALGLALYRIGQESLANVVKHAPGASVRVRLSVDAATARLTVDNTLPGGLPTKIGQGMGLSGMRQRVELLGGRITAGPYDDGWSVRVRFPLAPAKSGACVIFKQEAT
ncbi:MULTISPECIES: sensor histidine kinase [unclassified Nocardia]|uniref:sensor histidine kinase n=1 Tax=unclassified Nocardia TaxID=2637762 RepID=UPI001CE42403|nr:MULTISPECIES: sensor histidine kinase [unclassified Nocardia]